MNYQTTISEIIRGKRRVRKKPLKIFGAFMFALFPSIQPQQDQHLFIPSSYNSWSSTSLNLSTANVKGKSQGTHDMCYGEVLEEGGDEEVTFEGRSRKHMLVKERMGVKEVRIMVKETIGGNLSEHKVWYNLKYDRQMLMSVEANMDVRIIFNGNDEYGYLYMGDNDGPRRIFRDLQVDFDAN
ncbi:hypothetical protein Cgig2_027915 [Carnegiea gigantea]|uniref:Uncharacterized protein n=1 Tax=Carnegiea gigantea TaxID=171969 RepID=A0A9Q1KLN7_9CARY|nr:hypothetical protein Cgig2_027915 [Carnegiea gigantea]